MDTEIVTPPSGGACVDMSTSFFFPDPRTKGITKEMRKAIDTCNSCLVRIECADYGVRHEMYGIWGGLTESHRVALRKELGIVVKVPGYTDPAVNRIKR
jgi:hypothetical protein